MFVTKLSDSKCIWTANDNSQEHNEQCQHWIEPRAGFAMVLYIAYLEIKTTGTITLTWILLTATGFNVGIEGDVTFFGEIVCFQKGQLISKCPFGVIVWTKITTKKFDKFCHRI